MDTEDKNKVLYIQQQADELSAEIAKLIGENADLSEKRLNELIKKSSLLCSFYVKIQPYISQANTEFYYI